MLGVIVFQLPLDRINAVTTGGGNWTKAGLGESGETYLVAGDGSMRSESRFLLENLPGFLEVLASSGPE